MIAPYSGGLYVQLAHAAVASRLMRGAPRATHFSFAAIFSLL
jgi:hypothetical protein